MEEQWRPEGALKITLSDRQLAQLGLLAVFETNAKMYICLALKGAARLNYEQFQRLERQQFDQIMQSLAQAAAFDDELQRLVAVVNERKDVLTVRHQHLHGIWSSAPDADPSAFDIRRQKVLPASGIQDAVVRMADFTFTTRDCAYRVADLIVRGILPGGGSGGGPKLRCHGQLISF